MSRHFRVSQFHVLQIHVLQCHVLHFHVLRVYYTSCIAAVPAFSCGAFYVFSRPSFPVDPGNFGNCWPTFTIKFFHREARSSVCSKVVTDHHILNVSLHYLAKYLTPFRLAVASGAVLRHPVFYLSVKVKGYAKKHQSLLVLTIRDGTKQTNRRTDQRE